ncbi:hypothetical protein RI129_005637 [Pyrocoelia pectoralis]|uniref:DUF7041 domain-containing protein n=1 Tax=Pyrocoelia pectoralis TaxID=417401 RepID=A0AAN7VB22_9COLE
MATSEPPTASTPQDAPSASAITLPAFWPTRTELWFAMVESRFQLSHPAITREETKFHHVVTVLPSELADEVSDLIIKPDACEPYSKLKTAILKRTTLSESQRFKKLLAGESLGARKPSQLLRSMKDLVKDSGCVNNDALKELFMQQMPSAVQPILVSLNALTLEQLADVADRVVETTAPSLAPVVAEKDEQLTALIARLDRLESKLDKTERSRRSHSRKRSSNRSRSKSYDPEYCWYHCRFGEKASKCTSPCSYTPKNEDRQ